MRQQQRRRRRRRPFRWKWPVLLVLLSLLFELSSGLEFTQTEYSTHIPENSLGKVVATTDVMMGIWLKSYRNSSSNESLSIRYRILDGDDDNFFKTESVEVGNFVFLVIRTRASNLHVLNRERRSSYTLRVVARVRQRNADGGRGKRVKSLECQTSVVVNVVDTNDLEPIFASAEYEFVVDEDADLFTQVGKVRAEDADEGVNGDIYYYCFNHEDKDDKIVFGVDPSTGVVRVLGPLNYKERPKHVFLVAAVDRGLQSAFANMRPATTKVVVHVRQVNKNDPVLHVQPLPEIIEQSNTNIYALIHVTDPDPGLHGQVESVEIIEGDPEAHFRITRRRGNGKRSEEDDEFNIEVLHLLDREIAPYGYNLTLKATDRGKPKRSFYKNVHVKLSDLNDHAPIFDHQVYEVHVKESIPVHTPLVRLKVRDDDSGRNAEVRLKIVAGNEQGHFSIDDKQGVLYLAKPLDAETRTAFVLTVAAIDRANAGMRRQSAAKVRVHVEDVNDQSPVFQSQDFDDNNIVGTQKEEGVITVSFKENEPAASLVTRLTALDQDSGENGFVSYSLVNLEDIPFVIDTFSGAITTTKLLDFERDKREYRLIVRASDWGKPFRRQTEVVVIVRLQDVNDNRPQFERTQCKGDLPRDITPGSEFITLSALDLDNDDIISYRIVSGNADGCFGLDSSKGALSVLCDLRTLPEKSRTVAVTATDGEHFSDVTPILISLVSPVNERRRVFSTYDDMHFECQETSAATKLEEALKTSKKNNKHDMSSKIKHWGHAALSSVKFNANSPLGNLHQPEFNGDRVPNQISIRESLTTGSVVLKVFGRDRDPGYNGELLYVISDGDVDSVFKMDTFSGELLVYGQLDRERTTDYTLNITILDQGQPQRSASRLLRVLIEDVNDNAPMFSKSSYSLFFPENTPKGTHVVTMKASDSDRDLSGQVEYYLETHDDVFSIDEKEGTITVNMVLDREKEEFYDVVVRAQDKDETHPLSSRAVVRVRVLDVNDNTPVFSSTLYSVRVREDLPVGSVVGLVKASDPDLYQGGEVSYSIEEKRIENGSTGFLDIDSLSGVIRIKRKLDFESEQEIEINVKASDNGSPSLFSFSTFVLKVIDVDENAFAPNFNNFYTEAQVPESKAVGALVTTITATDNDDGNDDDGRIMYEISDGDGVGLFVIDDVGQIRTRVILDAETKSYYWLTVVACDKGHTPLCSKMFVHIVVLNSNDICPLSKEAVYRISLRENARPYSHVLTVDAVDEDIDLKSSRLFFEIAEGNPQNLFHIDPNTGIISTTKRRLDRETQAKHVLQILVKDNGIPSLNSTTAVVIDIVDENDNRPKFVERVFKIVVPEIVDLEETSTLMKDEEQKSVEKEQMEIEEKWDRMFKNTSWESFEAPNIDSRKLARRPIFRALATDKDDGLNSELQFSMKSSTARLQMEASTGIVYCTGNLVAGEELDLLVRAQDGGEKPLQALARASVSVVRNDGIIVKGNSSSSFNHPPRIVPPSRTQVFQSEEVNHLVAMIIADDKDDDYLWYYIESGDDNNHFYLHPNQGTIVVASSLSNLTKDFFNLTIAVSDSKSVTRTHLLVSIISSSDSVIEFKKPNYSVNVSESSDIGLILATFDYEAKNTRPELKPQPLFAIHNSQSESSLELFKIDPLKGRLMLKRKLDYEQNRKHVLTISVKDALNKQAIADYTRVIINVNDHNDHKPTFMNELIQLRTREFLPAGTRVAKLSAMDLDSGKNGLITYSIVSGNADNAFHLDNQTGLLTSTDRFLNTAERSEYMLMVRARDHGVPRLSSIVPIHILVTSLPEIQPLFTKSKYEIEVYEDAQEGEVLLQVRAESRSSLYYNIDEGDPNKLFFMSPSTGIITLAPRSQKLDYEKQKVFNLTVSATNIVSQKAIVQCVFHIMDVNDNAPKFRSLFYSGTISESASKGSLVLNQNHNSPLVLKASDADQGLNSLLDFSILDQVASGKFAIDDSTGALRVLDNLDYETEGSFEFDVSLSDLGSPRLRAEQVAHVVVHVVDENDNRPEFEKSEVEAILLLPTFNGLEVTRLTATDEDVCSQSKLSYDIVSGNEENRFSIGSKSGLITVNKGDEVGASSHYALEIVVTDGAFSDRCIVMVKVERADNSGLAFSENEYNVTVLENMKKKEVILVMNVLGASLEEHLEFSLLNNDEHLFEIGATTGALSTTDKAFDREQKAVHHLVVEVRSGGHQVVHRRLPRVAHVTVHATVVDINDEAPIFLDQPYHAVVPRESSKDRVVLEARAMDKDVGDNGRIYFQLIEGNGQLFRVGRKSGQITLRESLESHKEDEYRLVISAYDLGTPSLSTEAVVRIKVIDEVGPAFEQHLYMATIEENSDRQTPVITVQAQLPLDNDSEANATASNLMYSIENSNSPFSIDYSTGLISVDGKLDFELQSQHRLVVRATDAVQGGHVDATVLIGILDLNDCPPHFYNSSYVVSVSESMPIGSSLFEVTAIDRDTGDGGQLSYFIESQLGSRSDAILDIFDIDEKNGEVMLKGKLDFEREQRHEIVIVAKDHGQPSLNAKVLLTVEIEDSNDNAPVLDEAEFVFTVAAEAKRGHFVGKIRATDADVSDARRLRFNLIPSDLDNAREVEGDSDRNDVFDIGHRSGIVSLKRSRLNPKRSWYKMRVVVSDGVYSSSSLLTINVLRTNVFAPKFESDVFEVFFFENQPKGTSVAQILALDEDSYREELEYQLTSDAMNALFSIDKKSGSISSRLSLNREEKDRYDLAIRASDKGGRSGFATLTVKIGDVNDNGPKFEFTDYMVNVEFNATKGTPILQVKAADKDEGTNGLITYSILETKNNDSFKPLSLFNIDKAQGTIRLNVDADEVGNQVFQFFVRAMDQGRPKLHSDVAVEVYIMGKEDKKLEFESVDDVLYVHENTPVGRVLTQVRALLPNDAESNNSADDDDDDIIEYKLVSSAHQGETSLFAVQESKLLINGNLDREETDKHVVTIQARTSTSPALVSYITLTVVVLDHNDNDPIFEQRDDVVELIENVEAHTKVARVQAKDKDFGQNGQVSYRFGDDELTRKSLSAFTLDQTSGWITTKEVGSIDYEAETKHMLTIIAEDNGQPRRSSITSLTVNVVDVNDNAMSFSQRHFTAAINEGALPGSIVFQLNLDDEDKMALDKLAFFIVNGNDQGHFKIKANGELYVSGKLDRESTSSYSLKVMVSDGHFSAACKVYIEVLDDNDCWPKCVKNIVHLRLTEDALPGTEVVIVDVVDDDEGANARQIFDIKGKGAENFSVDRNKGIVSTLMPLDREQASSYDLEVIAKDAANPSWTCTTKLHVEIDDVNDVAPSFSSPVFTTSMKENLPVGTIVTKVTATDADLGLNSEVIYELIDSADNHFVIFSDSGLISLAKSLDREQCALHNLTVKASDKGVPRLTSTVSVIVLVLDINDNPPIFSSSVYFSSVTEDAAIDSEVVRILATSRDVGVNADITYSIIKGNDERAFDIDSKTGSIHVTSKLDAEKRAVHVLKVQAQDGGEPPLSNFATVNITISDVNDNAPFFTELSYSARVVESAKMKETVVNVSATDMDSNENGRITYSILSGNRLGHFDIDPNRGYISVAASLDREMVESYVLEVQAADNGLPKAKKTSVLVTIDIDDVNDNAPLFPEGNYTVYLPEDKPSGHVLVRFSVTDADATPNSSPFTFDIRSGNDDYAFRVVQDGSLRTSDHYVFDHTKKDNFALTIRVFDNGSPPLSSESIVVVNVIEASQFAPVVSSLDARLLLHEDGGMERVVVGRIEATDDDPYDSLTFDLVPGHYRTSALTTSSFEIDRSKGVITALEELDEGRYTLNVSVSDGKFRTFATARIAVIVVTDEELDDALILSLDGSVSPEDFVGEVMKKFVREVKRITGESRVLVLGVQWAKLEIEDDEERDNETFSTDNNLESETRVRRSIRSEEENGRVLQVMFTVEDIKGDTVPGHVVRRELEPHLKRLESSLSVGVLGFELDKCPKTHLGCENGGCVERLRMQYETTRAIQTSSSFSMVFPSFTHDAECECDVGYAGDKCSLVLNECARSPCPSFKLCVPDASFQGFDCVCPEGMIGARCSVNASSCNDQASNCDLVNPFTLSGKSYVQYSLLRSIERHLQVQLRLRTRHAAATLMFATGIVDYSVLELINGHVRYRFNFGSGEGLLSLPQVNVDDGKWHAIKVERHGNTAKLRVESEDGETFETQGASPGAHDVLNLNNSPIYFGARVQSSVDRHFDEVSQGFVGCMDDLRLDGVPLPLFLDTQSSVAKLDRLANVEFKCDASLEAPGVCGSQPCLNGGTCTAKDGRSDFVCSCPSRFSGLTCDFDLDPCASSPCLHNAQCVNLRNDFHCECPEHLSGKRCHYGHFCNPNPCKNGGLCEEGEHGPICKCRGFTGDTCTIDVDECLHQNPCRNGGTCINSNGGFFCVCPVNVTGPYCSERVNQPERLDYALKLEELVAVIASLFLLVLVVLLYVLCRSLAALKRDRRRANRRNDVGAGASYHVERDVDKQQELVLLRHENNATPTYVATSTLDQHVIGDHSEPLLPTNHVYLARPLSGSGSTYLSHEDGRVIYSECIRNYGAAADELESTTTTTGSSSVHQQTQFPSQRCVVASDLYAQPSKPMATVAPSMVTVATLPPHAASRPKLPPVRQQQMEEPTKATYATTSSTFSLRLTPNTAAALRVVAPPKAPPSAAASPVHSIVGAVSLSSLQTSVAGDESRYFWDSFDLNNGPNNGNGNSTNGAVNASSGGIHLTLHPQPSLSMVPEVTSPEEREAAEIGDIETLKEDEDTAANVAMSTSRSISVLESPPILTDSQAKSIEELLALNDDIDFADDNKPVFVKETSDDHTLTSMEDDSKLLKSKGHLNAYLPPHCVSETATPIMERHEPTAGPLDEDNDTEERICEIEEETLVCRRSSKDDLVSCSQEDRHSNPKVTSV